MIILANTTNYQSTSVTPDWFKAERYEYCENLVSEHKKARNEFLSKFFKKMGHR